MYDKWWKLNLALFDLDFNSNDVDNAVSNNS